MFILIIALLYLVRQLLMFSDNVSPQPLNRPREVVAANMTTHDRATPHGHISNAIWQRSCRRNERLLCLQVWAPWT